MAPRTFLGALCSAALATQTSAAEFAHFEPWTAVQGRDGNFYGEAAEYGPYGGGTVYQLIHPGMRRHVTGFTRAPHSAITNTGGSVPVGGLAVGPDGALYGRTAFGGAFSGGVIFKLDPQTRKRTTLYHLATWDSAGAIMVARDGTIYQSVNSYRVPEVMRIAKDGTITHLPFPDEYVSSLIESASGEIFAAGGQTGTIWRLNNTNTFDLLATVGRNAALKVALADGSLLGSSFSYSGTTTTTVFRVAPNGDLSTLHDFTSFEGSSVLSLFVAADGSYLGSTYSGGLEGYGTIFKIAATDSSFSIIQHLPGPNSKGRGQTWLNRVFPLVLEEAGENLPPCAKDDIIPASRVRPPKGSGPGTLPEVRIAALANDRDTNKDLLTITQVGSPTQGTATLDPSTQRIVYVANSTEVQNDSFSYTISDGHGGTAQARVVIRTNPAGRYEGAVTTVPGAVSGDPGSPVGTLTLRVNASGTARAVARIYDRKFSFTGQFNELNQFGKTLARKPGTSDITALQLHLRPNGASWTIEAEVRKDYHPSTATLAPSP